MTKRKPEGRVQRFVLTAEEKRTLGFVGVMFLLGLATMVYRAKHERHVAIREQNVTPAARATRVSAQPHTTPRAPVTPDDVDDEEQ